jgi:hypothetical protein
VIRLAEALAALSLATDAGNGQPLEKSLRNAVIEALGLRGREHSEVYYTALLRSIGCTAYALTARCARKRRCSVATTSRSTRSTRCSIPGIRRRSRAMS